MWLLTMEEWKTFINWDIRESVGAAMSKVSGQVLAALPWPAY